MLVNNKHYETIWLNNDKSKIKIIDQRVLPFGFIVEELTTVDDVCVAIKDMHVRGAPLIGVTAAYGMYLAMLHAGNDDTGRTIQSAAKKLNAARPTAVNLSYAVNWQLKTIASATGYKEKLETALITADKIKAMELDHSINIGKHGVSIIRELGLAKQGKPVNILTHCNAGWLACVDYGTATAPVYFAQKAGIDIHVWVDETRPRNQGARLTAWELEQQGIPHTVIADNTGGHLMQHGMVDVVIVGSDRTTITGDVANKIGTYLKALAAHDNNIPFYVALPSSTIDRNINDGINQIPIEQRNPDEVKFIDGCHNNEVKQVRLTPEHSPAANYAFDVTPSRLVTGLITEKGICKANKQSILKLFPGKK